MYSIPLPRLQDNRCYLTSNGLDWVDIPASNRDKIRISLEGRSYSIQAPPSAVPLHLERAPYGLAKSSAQKEKKEPA